MRKRFNRKIFLYLFLVFAAVFLPAAFFQPFKIFLFDSLTPLFSLRQSIAKPFVDVKYEELEKENKRLQAELLLAKQKSLRNLSQAEVIFRSQAAWNEALWINIGKTDVKLLSPVLKGDILIGLVDFVGKNQARVKLITNPKFSTSVRAVRKINGRTYLLAKGELEGATDKSFRSQGTKLIGSGFNYDFPDSEGPARDLRSGTPVEGGQEIPIIKAEDLLVTTGLDGFYPKGIKVAKVIKVKPLKEGDAYYEIEAESLAGNFNDLKWVSVLAPSVFDPEDMPQFK